MADQTYTLASKKVGILGTDITAQHGFTHKFTIEEADVDGTNAGGTWTTDGDTVTITLLTTSTDFLVTKAASNIVTAFATDGTLTYQVGTDGDPNNFLTDTDALTAGPLIAGIGAAPVTLAGTFAAAADNLTVRFSTQAGTGAPADITAGKLEIYLGLVNMNDLSSGTY